jgi:hypothetical protein
MKTNRFTSLPTGSGNNTTWSIVILIGGNCSRLRKCAKAKQISDYKHNQ